MRRYLVILGALVIVGCGAAIALSSSDPPQASHQTTPVLPPHLAKQPAVPTGEVLDTDGDGLPDFWERHKYRTNPNEADSDGDGVPDGEWRERREFTYSIETIIRVMPPYKLAALNDDYQDVRVLEERPGEYVELKVVHYPLNTVADGVTGSEGWRASTAHLAEYTAPGVTTNWDPELAAYLAARLTASGIDVQSADDKTLVEAVSRWVMDNTKGLDTFTTYYVQFSDGEAQVHPDLIDAFENGKARADWSPEEQFAHELYGREMLYNRTRGTCTSSAVLLTTALRAVGIPTRMVLAIPLVDGSDPNNVKRLDNLQNHRVRALIQRGIQRIGTSFTAHTFNEVYVAGRWRRLNYGKLGQNILDERLYGLLTHVHTFGDLSEADLAAHWGARHPSRVDNPIFRHNNPYTALAVSDWFGPHSGLDNPQRELIQQHQKLTITKLYWFDSPARPGWIEASSVKDDGSGHLLAHVEEWLDGEGIDQYRAIYGAIDKRFALVAPGYPEVEAEARRGYWQSEFYIQIPKEQVVRLAPGVHYELVPYNGRSPFHWEVEGDVFLEGR